MKIFLVLITLISTPSFADEWTTPSVESLSLAIDDFCYEIDMNEELSGYFKQEWAADIALKLASLSPIEHNKFTLHRLSEKYQSTPECRGAYLMLADEMYKSIEEQILVDEQQNFARSALNDTFTVIAVVYGFRYARGAKSAWGSGLKGTERIVHYIKKLLESSFGKGAGWKNRAEIVGLKYGSPFIAGHSLYETLKQKKSNPKLVLDSVHTELIDQEIELMSKIMNQAMAERDYDDIEDNLLKHEQISTQMDETLELAEERLRTMATNHPQSVRGKLSFAIELLDKTKEAVIPYQTAITLASFRVREEQMNDEDQLELP